MATWKDTGALSTPSGGTGFASYTDGALLYGLTSGPNGLGQLAIQPAGYLLGSTGIIPTWTNTLDLEATTAVGRTLIGQGVTTNVTHFLNTTPVSGPHFAVVSQVTGMAAAGTPSYKVSVYSAAETGARGDDVFAFNGVIQWDAGHPASNIIGLEIDVNNNNADRTLNQTPWVTGVIIASGGTKKPGKAVIIGATSAANKWMKGIDIGDSVVDVNGACIDVGGVHLGETGTILARQLQDGGQTLLLQRRTDTTPTGTLIIAKDTLSSTVIFQIDVTGVITTTGAALLITASGASIEVGNPLAASSPHIDFHSGGSNIDYDTRILSSSGSGSSGHGTMFLIGDAVQINVNGNTVAAMIVSTGVQVGSPGSGAMGTGTINIAGDIYQNGVGYTHPHFVFEQAYTGAIVRFRDRMKAMGVDDYRRLSLEELEAFTRQHHHFPGFEDEARLGLFSGGDRLLLVTEELALHLFDVHRRLLTLEDRSHADHRMA